MGKVGGAPLRSLSTHLLCPASTATATTTTAVPGEWEWAPGASAPPGPLPDSFASLFDRTADACPGHCLSRSLSETAARPSTAFQGQPEETVANFGRLVGELNALLRSQRRSAHLRPGGGGRHTPSDLRRPVSPSQFPPSPRLHCQLGHAWRSRLSQETSPSPPPGPPKAFAEAQPYTLKPSYSLPTTAPTPSSSRPSLLCLEMGQRLARQDVDEGVRLYHLQKHEEAVARWRAALRRLRTPEDRFITMGYLAQAYCESGSYQDMLSFALQQIELANAQEDSYMRAEAFLNLARANERVAEFHKAIQYGRHSLENQSMDPRTPGYAYLCIGTAFLGFSNFQLSLDHLEQAMRVANSTQDRLLELQICVALGNLFTQIKDLSKAVVFLKNALGLLKTVSIVDVQAKYRSLVLYQLSVALRRKGAMTDAKQAAEEALRLAAENGNRPIQGRCLHALGDIHREYRDVEKTWSRYEAGLALLEELEDRMGQLWLLTSMAKTALSLQRPEQQHCECQAIQLNKRVLDLAKAIGCKLGMLKAHGRLAGIYRGLQDEESEEVARKAATGLVQEMELFCNFCGQRYALSDNSLQALPCSHIFHEKCLQTYLSGRERKECPKCEHRAATLASLPSTSAQPPPPPQPHPRVVLLAEEETGATGRRGSSNGGASPPFRIGTRSPSLDEQRAAAAALRLDDAPSPVLEEDAASSTSLQAFASFKPASARHAAPYPIPEPEPPLPPPPALTAALPPTSAPVSSTGQSVSSAPPARQKSYTVTEV